MLSTAYRLRLEKICERISTQNEVSIEDMIWAEKLSKSNRSAATMLRQARRMSLNTEMKEGSLDHFLNALDLGDPDPQNHKEQFDSAVDIAEWFKREEDGEEWRRRD